MTLRSILSCVVFVSAWAASPLVAAQSAKSVVVTDQVHAELLAHAPEGVAPGKPIWLGLQLTHQPEWHTYWKNPGDSGLPTALNWSLPAGVTAGEIAWPLPKKIPIGNLANYGYEGTVLLPVPLSAMPEFRPGLLNDAGHQAQSHLVGVQERVHSRRGRICIETAAQKHHGAARCGF
jgi:DsbC/DsbD-like thiol-disulfide interchange protein